MLGLLTMPLRVSLSLNAPQHAACTILGGMLPRHGGQSRARGQQTPARHWLLLAAGVALGIALSTIGNAWQGGGKADGHLKPKLQTGFAAGDARPAVLAFVGVQVGIGTCWDGLQAAPPHRLQPPPPPAVVTSCVVDSLFGTAALLPRPPSPQTGFTTDSRPKYNYEARRAALRASWFPGSPQELARCAA